MLGESDVYEPSVFGAVCASGLECDWITAWHGGVAENHGYRLAAIDVCRGHALPAPQDVAAVILGGTLHSVAEDRAWLADITVWLRRYRETGNPLLAICGGHQLIATRMEGGTLADHSGHTQLRTSRITLTDAGRGHPLFYGLPETPRFHFGNMQYVEPSEAQMSRVLAVDDVHPACVLDHGGRWFSSQFHPEARKAVFDSYFQSRDAHFDSAYTEAHDGPALLANFLRLGATPGRPLTGKSSSAPTRQGALFLV